MRSLDHLRPSKAYWQASSLTDELRLVQGAALEVLNAGEAEAAYKILCALLEESHAGFNYVDDSDGELREFLHHLGDPLAEIVLSLNPGEDRRRQLLNDLNRLNRKLNDYGVGGLDVALAAAQFGWNDPPGRLSSREAARYPRSESADSLARRLTRAKLNVLERHGEIDAFLVLCLQTGEHLRYALKLCQLSRVPEAVGYAMQMLPDADSALHLAQDLARSGHPDEALGIGERGLKLGGRKSLLCHWLGPAQEARGRAAQALEAWMAAFHESPSLEIYQNVRRLAGSRWSRIKPEVMNVLKQRRDLEEFVKVLLFEEQWDAAIKIADRRDAPAGLVRLAADALIEHRPEWVIRATTRRTAELIGKIHSKHYSVAADWLEKTKAAYSRLGRTREWEAYLERLKEQYRKRPALQSYLAKL
jgi:hypothetical protein